MAQKKVNLPKLGEVTLIKRKGNRNIRLTFDSHGNLRISLPIYAPYRAGIAFANQKEAWIASHRPQTKALITPGQTIAGRFEIRFVSNPTAKQPRSRIKSNQIIVAVPTGLDTSDTSVQAAALRGATRAVKQEAERLLPGRLAELAKTYGYKFRSVKIKPFKRRWGSCDSKGNIALNQFLVTLPPELIDYVLLHELAHTVHQHHQAEFWRELKKHLPDVDNLKKQARARQPEISPQTLPL